MSPREGAAPGRPLPGSSRRAATPSAHPSRGAPLHFATFPCGSLQVHACARARGVVEWAALRGHCLDRATLPAPRTSPRPQNGRASWLTSSDSRGRGATPYPTRDFARRSGRIGRIAASREAERNRFATQSPRKRFPHRTPLRGYAEKRFRRYGRTPGESRFRIAAKPRAMRTGFRRGWRREAVAVSGRETRDPRRGPLTILTIPTI